MLLNCITLYEEEFLLFSITLTDANRVDKIMRTTVNIMRFNLTAPQTAASKNDRAVESTALSHSFNIN